MKVSTDAGDLRSFIRMLESMKGVGSFGKRMVRDKLIRFLKALRREEEKGVEYEKVSVNLFEVEEATKVVKEVKGRALSTKMQERLSFVHRIMEDILKQCKVTPCTTCSYFKENTLCNYLNSAEDYCSNYNKWKPVKEKLTTCGCPQCEEKMRIYLDHIEEMLKGPKVCPHSLEIPTVKDGRVVL